MPQRTYSQEEVDAILDRALRQQSKDASKLTHDELVAAAGEVGIPKDAIDNAAHDIDRGTKAHSSDQEIFATWKQRARAGFIRHFTVFFLVNAMLAFINFATSSQFLWFLIVTFGWGIGVVMHLLGIVLADKERVLEREARRAERRARRQRWKKRGSEFEQAVDHGVRSLLDMANKHSTGPRVEPDRVRVEQTEWRDEEEETSQEQNAKRR